jgi:hypothetical protein
MKIDFRQKLGLFSVITAFVLCGILFANPPSKWLEPVKNPEIFSLPEGVEFDCVLLKYTSEKNAPWAGDKIIMVIKGGRVVTYPDGYVPVLIHKDEVKRVKKELGSKALVISPELE